jgi:hypothetical protein
MAVAKLLRFGEWFEQNRHKYTVQVISQEVIVGSNGYNEVTVTYRKQPVDVVPTASMVALFNDYDNYLDNNLVL